MVVSRKCKMIN